MKLYLAKFKLRTHFYMSGSKTEDKQRLVWAIDEYDATKKIEKEYNGRNEPGDDHVLVWELELEEALA